MLYNEIDKKGEKVLKVDDINVPSVSCIGHISTQ